MGKDYRRLKVWQKSHELVLKVYRITGEFPKSELFGLVSQMRRASVSIPANIAEGSGRRGIKEHIQFLYHAFGSCNELGYHLYLAKDLSFIDDKVYQAMNELHSEVGRMLYCLITRIERDVSNS